MTHDLKRRFEAEDYLAGTWVSVGHPTIAEVCAVGFDFVLVDTEHTTISLETVEDMVRAVDAAPGTTTVVVRVPWNDPVRLKRVLDVGVGGVMVPMVSSRADAESFVDSVRYPPEGIRGLASGRAAGYGRNFEEYYRTSNDSLFSAVQIETEEGLENVDEIAAVDGVDSLFVGPADLSAALGVFGELDSDPYEDAVESVVAAGDAHDLPVGTLTTDPEAVASLVERGFDYLVIRKDTSTLLEANRNAIETYERAIDRLASTAANDD
jgi:2-keto-3-deoxy-L-rhamnonate aldolase RhmA